MLANPATPSPPARPIATPTANNSARLANIMSPDCSMIFATMTNQSAFKAGIRFVNCSF